MPTTAVPVPVPPNPIQHTGVGFIFIGTAVTLLVAFAVLVLVMWGLARLRGRQLHPRLRSWWVLGAVVLLIGVASFMVTPVSSSSSSRVHLIPTPSTRG
ncbi:MAG: hypothetical protein ACRDZ8_00040 [Acidimicrobiales bacterium]